MILLRAIAVLILAVLTALCALVAFMPADTELAHSSLQRQQEILADFQKMGQFTESARQRNGVVPTTENLLAWMETQEFEYRWFDEYKDDPRPTSLSLVVIPSDEEFIVGEESSLSRGDGHTYRIAYWNNWTHEYAPETGNHTLPTSVQDYAPKPWQRALLGLLMAGFLVLIARLTGLLPISRVIR